MTTFQKHFVRITSVATLMMAGIAHAQLNGTGQTGGSSSGTVGGMIGSFLTFVNSYVVPLIFAVAFLMFLWGIFRYFIAGGDSDENRKEGRMFLLYAIIGFVLMVSIWGIVNVIHDSIGFGNESSPGFPTVNPGGGSTQSGQSTQNSSYGQGFVGQGQGIN